MLVDPQSYYQAGFKAGQNLHGTYLPSELRKIADDEMKALKDPVPMTMQVHFKAGVVAGYESMKNGRESDQTMQKRQL